MEMILLRPYHSSPWACSSPASSSSRCRPLKERSLQGRLADHTGPPAVESASLRSLHGRAESPCSTCRSSVSLLPQSWSHAGWSRWLNSLGTRGEVYESESHLLYLWWEMELAGGPDNCWILQYSVSLRQAPQQPGISEGWVLCEQRKRRRAVGTGLGSLLASGAHVCTCFPHSALVSARVGAASVGLCCVADGPPGLAASPVLP